MQAGAQQRAHSPPLCPPVSSLACDGDEVRCYIMWLHRSYRKVELYNGCVQLSPPPPPLHSLQPLPPPYLWLAGRFVQWFELTCAIIMAKLALLAFVVLTATKARHVIFSALESFEIDSSSESSYSAAAAAAAGAGGFEEFLMNCLLYTCWCSDMEERRRYKSVNWRHIYGECQVCALNCGKICKKLCRFLCTYAPNM